MLCRARFGGGGVLGVTKTPHSYLQMYSRSILKAWRIEKHESGNSFFFLGGGGGKSKPWGKHRLL